MLLKKKSGEYTLGSVSIIGALNAVTRRDVFPIPHIDDMQDEARRSLLSSMLVRDLGRLRWEQDQTAFSTHDGFGVYNGPATFQ